MTGQVRGFHDPEPGSLKSLISVLKSTRLVHWNRSGRPTRIHWNRSGWFTRFTGINQVQGHRDLGSGSKVSHHWIRFKGFTPLDQVQRFHDLGSRSRFDTTFEQVGSMILPTRGTHPDSNTHKHTQQGTLPHTLTAR